MTEVCPLTNNRLPAMAEFDQESSYFTTSSEEESVDLSKLFPVRALPTLQDMPANFHKDISSALSCSICLQNLNKPVFLKCAHRFCKECIERKLRLNNIKQCPQCDMKIASRRDLRPDHDTQSLLNALMGSRSLESSCTAGTDLTLGKKRDKEERKMPRTGSKKRKANSNEDSLSVTPRRVVDINHLEEAIEEKQDVIDAKEPVNNSDQPARAQQRSASEEDERCHVGYKWNLQYEMSGLTKSELNQVKLNFPALSGLYGTLYLRKLQILTGTQSFMMELKLVPRSDCLMTPPLSHSVYRVSVWQKASSLSELVAQELGISECLVRLWVLWEGALQELRKKEGLLRLDEKYWRSQKGIVAGSAVKPEIERGQSGEVEREVQYEVMV